MNKIPTADEFLDSHPMDENESIHDDCKRNMLEFAKLHVKAALEAVTNNAKMECNYENGRYSTDDYYATDYGSITIDKRSILDAYPESNIK